MHVPASPRAKLSSLVVGALVVATAVSCTDGGTDPTRPSFNVTPPGPTQSKVCKYGPVGSYTFSITSSAPLNGTMLVSSPLTITVADEHGSCVFIHQSGEGTDNLVIRETPLPTGIVVDKIVTGAIGDGCHTDASLCAVEHTGTDQVTLSPTASTGFYAFFFNKTADNPPPPPPPPPPAGEGCTPGYWKNHLDSWTGYSPRGDFDRTFGVNLFAPNITLGEAVNLGAGGVNQLARHATAALLNAAHSGVAYGMTTSEVIALVREAAATGEYEKIALRFEALNERNCRLN